MKCLRCGSDNIISEHDVQVGIYTVRCGDCGRTGISTSRDKAFRYVVAKKCPIGKDSACIYEDCSWYDDDEQECKVGIAGEE